MPDRLFERIPHWLRDPGLIALASAVASAIWVLMPLLVHWISFQFDVSTRRFKVDLGRAISESVYKADWQGATSFGCLFLRFGADDYLVHLASNEEREIGRLRFEKRDMRLLFDRQSGSAYFDFTMPVHYRLGAQFKCYMDDNSQGKLKSIKETISAWKNIKSIDPSGKPKVNRWWILFDTFACLSDTGEGTDYCAPAGENLPLKGLINNFIPAEPD